MPSRGPGPEGEGKALPLDAQALVQIRMGVAFLRLLYPDRRWTAS